MENSGDDLKCENGQLKMFTYTSLATTPSEYRGSFQAQEPTNDPPFQEEGQVPLGLGGDEVTIYTSVIGGGTSSRALPGISIEDQGVSGQNQMIGEVLGVVAKQDLDSQPQIDQDLIQKSSQKQPIAQEYDKKEDIKEQNKEKVTKDTHFKFKSKLLIDSQQTYQ
eukprot:403371256